MGIEGVVTGNAGAERVGNHGWFFGHFMADADHRRTDLELKWGVHAKGEREAEGWVANRTSTTFSLLVEGRVLIKLRREGLVEEVRLEAAGDYVLWEPGVEHCLEIEEDCIIFSVRCPSVADDQIKQPL